MKPFNTYLREKDFQAVFNFLTDKTKSENMHSEKYRTLAKPLWKALDEFLKEYKKENYLGAILHSESHTTNPSSFWNKYMEDQITNRQEIYNELDILFSKAMFYTIMDAEYKVEKANDSTEHNPNIENNANNLKTERLNASSLAYTLWCEQVDKGDFRSFILPDSSYCFCCGERFCMEVKGWQPKFLSIEFTNVNGKSKMNYVEPKTCFGNSVEHLEIQFTTGELLVSDWFRIAEFTKVTQEDFDVNSTQGRVLQVKYLLENFNFLSIPSTGSADIFKHGNCFAFGNYDEEYGIPDDTSSYTDEELDAIMEAQSDEVTDGNHTYKSLGYVNSGLRNVTIIEKEQLIAVVAKHEDINNDLEKATAIVEEYLKENSYEIKKLKVKPGTYTVSFSGNWYDFNKQLNDSEKFSPNFEPYFTLKNNLELTKTNKPKMK